MAFFGGAALLLSCVGIYGVFSYAVSQRTREIGIRMALGQDPAASATRSCSKGCAMTAISAASRRCSPRMLLTRSVAALLYGVKAADPATFATMAAVLMVAALAGCYVPARRATRSTRSSR